MKNSGKTVAKEKFNYKTSMISILYPIISAMTEGSLLRRSDKLSQEYSFPEEGDKEKEY